MMSCTATTFGRGVERFPWEGDEAGDGGDVDDASPAGDGGVDEQRVRSWLRWKHDSWLVAMIQE